MQLIYIFIFQVLNESLRADQDETSQPPDVFMEECNGQKSPATESAHAIISTQTELQVVEIVSTFVCIFLYTHYLGIVNFSNFGFLTMHFFLGGGRLAWGWVRIVLLVQRASLM